MMNKLIISLAMMAVLAVGCQKPEILEQAVDREQFTASVEAFGSQAKTAISQDNCVVWSTNDRLAVFQASSMGDEYVVSDSSVGKMNGTFDLVSDNSTINGSFIAGAEVPCNVGFYPYMSGLTLAASIFDKEGAAYTVEGFHLPHVQQYTIQSFANGSFPMVAVSKSLSDHNLNFRNVLGAIKLSFKGSLKVLSINVKGNNKEILSGPATITAYANNLNPTISMTGSEDGNRSITLDCGDGVHLNESEVTSFIITLPPVHFEKGFTVTVTDSQERCYLLTADIANTVFRSSILVMPDYTIDGNFNVDQDKSDMGESAVEDYIDEYGINHGPGIELDGIVWAPVNLGYKAEVVDIDGNITYLGFPYGKLYQWGRRYGQGYSGDLYDRDKNKIGTVSDATVPMIAEGGVSLEAGQSDNKKNTFFIGSKDSYYDWLYPADGTLWNAGSETHPMKSFYDPCPAGWRVPTRSELSDLVQNRSFWTTDASGHHGYYFSGANLYKSGVLSVFLPAAGERFSGSSVYGRGCFGVYWSSTSYKESNSIWALEFNSENRYDTVLSRSTATSVRCVQDGRVAVASIELDQEEISLYKGLSYELCTTVLPAEATDKSVVWSSSNDRVVNVNQEGLVTAVAEGNAVISAKAGAKITTCTVTVLPIATATRDYIDDDNINHGKGTAIGMVVWAPVNCGYHATDYQWGKLYQWGRKYGQGYSGALLDGQYDYITDVSDATPPEFSEGAVSLDIGQSVSKENIFFTDYAYYDWLYPADGTLWNSGTEDSPKKTEYDPCPSGWRVPTWSELEELYQNQSYSVTNAAGQLGCWFSGAIIYNEEIPQVFLPLAGYREYSGYAYWRGQYGRYWSSTPYSDLYGAYHIIFASGHTVMGDYCRAEGYSVRCVQE